MWVDNILKTCYPLADMPGFDGLINSYVQIIREHMCIEQKIKCFFMTIVIALLITQKNYVYSQQTYWETMNVPDKPYWGLTTDYKGDVFIGASWYGNDSTGIMRSTNNGHTWVSINEGLTSFQILCININPKGEVYTGTSKGELFKYNGQNWSKLNVPWNLMQVRSVVFQGEDIIVGLYDPNGSKKNSIIYFTDNNGATWNIVKSDTTAFGIISMISIPNGKLCVSYAGSANTHLITYKNSTTEYIGTDKDTLGFACLSYDSLTNTIYGGSASGVYKYDGNTSWELLNTGISPKWVSSIAFNQYGIMFAGTFGYGIYRASNMGASWSAQLNDGLSTNWIRRLFFDKNGYLYVTTDNGVLRSKNLITGINTRQDFYPNIYKLYQNYPNPFNPSTTISFSLSSPGTVELSIYNLLGEKVTTLISEYMPSGFYQKIYIPNNISSGVYFFKLNIGNNIISRKMIYVK